MMRFGAILFAAAFSVQPLPQADGPLEPSVQNEVDHAIDKGERWLEKNFKKATCDADAINCVPPVCCCTFSVLAGTESWYSFRHMGLLLVRFELV